VEAVWLPECNGYLRAIDLPGENRPLVFLHCLGGASSGYVATACHPALAGQRRLLIDLPGYGCSDRPQHFGYTLGDLAATIAALLDRRGIARAIVVGHSMGGSVAIVLAERRPDLVGHLIVAEPPLVLSDESASRLIAAQSEAAFVAHGFARFLGARLEEAASDTVTAAFLGMFALAAPHAVHRTANSMVATTPTLFDRLAAFAGPRTYIWGERTLAHDSRAARLDERLRAAGVDTVTVPGAGHHPNLDNSVGFAAAIAEILFPS
jgi:pimeloyl-ACP methyl ester carboxylesterase